MRETGSCASRRRTASLTRPRIVAELPLRLRQQHRPVEPEEALQQEARIALGRFYSGGGEGSRHQRQRRSDCLIGAERLH